MEDGESDKHQTFTSLCSLPHTLRTCTDITQTYFQSSTNMFAPPQQPFIYHVKLNSFFPFLCVISLNLRFLFGLVGPPVESLQGVAMVRVCTPPVSGQIQWCLNVFLSVFSDMCTHWHDTAQQHASESLSLLQVTLKCCAIMLEWNHQN